MPQTDGSPRTRPAHPHASNACVVGDDTVTPVEIGPGRPLAVIAGPCALESRSLCLEVAGTLSAACAELGVGYIFKGSFDKANRTSAGADRGPGLAEGLAILDEVRRTVGVPVTTDIHEPRQPAELRGVVDLIQIPAFLCRQTDLLTAAAHAASERAGGAINIKKGQFLSPAEMLGPVKKCQAAGCTNIMLTERGTFFGYHRLVNDLIGLGDLMQLDPNDQHPAPTPPAPVGANEGRRGGPPVCFDATHSAQLPGAASTAAGAASGGRGERVPTLARAAVAAGVDAVFIECHPDPPSAASDRATMVALDAMPDLLASLVAISAAVGRMPAER